MTVSKTLSAVWAFFAVSLLAAGCVTIAYSVNWGMPNMIIQFVIDNTLLKAGLFLGVTYAFTFVVATIAISQPINVTIGLSALNWILLLDTLITLVMGSVIWFTTLKQRTMYGERWDAASDDVRNALQNEFSCCGYMTLDEANLAQGGTCPIANSPTIPCVGPLMQYADWTINSIFSSVYGFLAIIVGLFLASCCVINKRIEAERFRRIDLKRGGGGFV